MRGRPYASVAQRLEQVPLKVEVVGSNPTRSTMRTNDLSLQHAQFYYRVPNKDGMDLRVGEKFVLGEYEHTVIELQSMNRFTDGGVGPHSWMVKTRVWRV